MKRILCIALFLVCLLTVLSVSAAQNVVSLHKSYELVTKASEGYPDAGGELTNGKYGTPVDNGTNQYYYRDEEFVGFNRSDANADGNFVIVLDLAEQYNDLADFEVGYLNETDVGIFAPAKVAFYISDSRNGDYTFVGERALSESTAAGQQKAGIATVTPESPVSGRYVMCVITPRGTYTDENQQERTATWTFLDEITVLQGQNNVSDNSQTSENSTESSSASSAESQTPPTGDRGLLMLAILGGSSALGTVALIGRRRA